MSGSEFLAENADVAMEDAATTATEEELQVRIANKIKSDLRKPRVGSFMDKFSKLTYEPVISDELQELKNAEAHPIDFGQTTGEGSQLFGCNVDRTSEFLGLQSVLKKFYIRDGYDALFNKILTCWQDEMESKVTLIGNAGTGKSWFQVYVLRELLRNRNGYKYIIRQVGTSVYIIDLEETIGYVWYFTEYASIILNQVKHAVYLYEPAQEKEQPPMGLDLPSLATLSPYNKRIAEYKKSYNHITLYFWPWTLSAMAAVANDSQLELKYEDLLVRYEKFGGIIRHVLKRNITGPSNELSEKLQNVSASVLQKVVLNIDRDESSGNVSGYILCYNNKHEDEDRFTRKVLEFTSPYVESKVQQIIDALPLKEKAKTVLDRLNKEVVDLSGKNLEAVGTELLSKGSHGTGYSWRSKEVGGQNNWSAFNLTRRNVVRLWNVFEYLHRPNEILVSTISNFPLGDIVFTPNDRAGPIDVVQFTWQPSHPFTIRALYDLRKRRLKVDHSVVVKLYIISPGMEDKYAGMSKTVFLKGSLEEPFQWSANTEPLQPGHLQEMWNNTQVHVIRPDQDWKIMLENYIRTL